MFIVAKRLDGSRWNLALGMEVGLSPGDLVVLDGDPVPLLKKGTEPIPNFRPISIVAKRLHAPKCHLVRSKPQPRALCVRWRPSPLPKKGAEPPKFSPVLIVAKRLDGSRWHLAWR